MEREGKREEAGEGKSILCSAWDTGLSNSLVTHRVPLKEFKVGGLLKSINKGHLYPISPLLY